MSVEHTQTKGDTNQKIKERKMDDLQQTLQLHILDSSSATDSTNPYSYHVTQQTSSVSKQEHYQWD